MRKYTVIGVSMLLLALAACTREKDTLPADGFVKMRFTAVVDDGDTRTAYENDKTASWVAGDAISVYVTNGSEGQVVTFTAGEDLTFEGDVPAGYTTIVAGAYPADAAHTFDANGVKTIHFPASYTLDEGDDPASVLPLAGTFAEDVMTFRHPAGALKFTIDNVPATAVRFRFTAAGQKVNGSFAMDPALANTEVEAEKSVDISVPAAAGSRSFYVPMPAGELTAGAAIALYDAENNILFQKAVPQAMTVNKNVIKRIAAVETWKKNEEWQATYLRDVYSTSSQKVGSYVQVTGTMGPHDIYLSSKSYFESHYRSIEDFLSSSFISDKQANGASPKTKNATYNYSRLSPGAYVAIIYGLDENYNFTDEYNLIEFEVPEFTTPEGWDIEFNPKYKLSNGEIHPAVHVRVPEGTSYSTVNLKKEDFLNSFGGDAVAFIWSRRTSTSTIRTNTNINLYFSSLDETDYVYIVYGVHERENEDSDRTFTYEYALLEYTYTKPSDEPTEAYLAWIGQWNVADETNTDTWTISANQNNETYSISGLIGKTSSTFVVEGLFNEADGTLQINAQMDIRTFNGKMSDGNTYEASLGLFGRKEASGSFYTYKTTPYQLLKATMNGTENTSATLAPAGDTYLYYSFLASYTNENGESKWAGYGTRPANATMTRVETSGVMRSDGWAEEAEDFTQGPAPAFEGTEVVEAEA